MTALRWTLAPLLDEVGIALNEVDCILRGGTLVPCHEPRIFEEPQESGFRRISAHAVALVE